MKSHSQVASIKPTAFCSGGNSLRCEKFVTISVQHPIEIRDSGCWRNSQELNDEKGLKKFDVTDCVSRPGLQRE